MNDLEQTNQFFWSGAPVFFCSAPLPGGSVARGSVVKCSSLRNIVGDLGMKSQKTNLEAPKRRT